jgi:hypothetical protein
LALARHFRVALSLWSAKDAPSMAKISHLTVRVRLGGLTSR